MTDFLERWAEQDPRRARLVAQETLITEVAEAIWRALEEAGVSKVELAERMETSRGYVSQVLNGSRNMTLRTLSDICFALAKRPVIRMESREPAGGWETAAGGKVRVGAGNLRYRRTGNVCTPVDGWQRVA